MTKVFCFAFETWVPYTRKGSMDQIFVSCAITEHGKWLAGAVSRKHDAAVERVANMAAAKVKAPGLISDETEIVKCFVFEEQGDAIRSAMRIAFKNMP